MTHIQFNEYFKVFPNIILACQFVLILSALVYAGEIIMRVETGMVSCYYNDIQVPKNTGTRFSLTDNFTVAEQGFARLQLVYAINPKTRLEGLIAPLSLRASGVLSGNVLFSGVQFNAGEHVDGKYRFDSYRVTYKKLLADKKRFKFWLGGTAKIRDAEISFRSAEHSAAKLNTGFVPLLHFDMDYKLSEKVSISFAGDALAGGPGRAEDAALTAGYEFSKGNKIYGGYRIVEGGADVEEVYNFTGLNYFFIGCSISFN